ncbi:protein of unknown function (plasmid) [Streptantibioticus cattleyicolor NRRL 8057 = DSM 46488]|nr:protein of unknown function [Streptantibioticus cattleyicolor NRRL 8057 = DSM 46488]
MLGEPVAADDGLEGGLGDRLAFQEVVDVVVGDAERVLVGPPRVQRLQVRGRGLPHQLGRGAEGFGHRPYPPLGETGERHHVGRAITELGEEPGDRLRRVIRAHHQAVVRARHRVLGDHALPCLDVAVHEVLVTRVTEDRAAGQHRLQRGVARGLHVHGEHLVGPDELQRQPRVLLVRLHAVRQPHREERGLPSRGADPLDRELAQPARRRGVHPAADAQHQRTQPRDGQLTGEEGHPALDLLPRLEGRAHPEIPGDLQLRGYGRLVGHGCSSVGPPARFGRRRPARATGTCSGENTLEDGGEALLTPYGTATVPEVSAVVRRVASSSPEDERHHDATRPFGSARGRRRAEVPSWVTRNS